MVGARRGISSIRVCGVGQLSIELKLAGFRVRCCERVSLVSDARLTLRPKQESDHPPASSGSTFLALPGPIWQGVSRLGIGLTKEAKRHTRCADQAELGGQGKSIYIGEGALGGV